jgi:S1-C subfamily serine protease
MFGGRAIGGAELNELNPDLGEYFGTETGVLIVRVPNGTPAARAGLQAGDVILSINGRDIESMSDLRSAVGRSSREPIRIEILRKKNRQTIELR